MKTLLLTLLLAFSVSAQADGFFHEQDKRKHMALSALGANLLRAGGATEQEAFWTMVGIGLAKEVIWDGSGNSDREHARDMAANILGAGTVFVWKIEF